MRIVSCAPLLAALALTACVGLGGCTTRLASSPQGGGTKVAVDAGRHAEVGASYALPMLQFQIDVQRTLVECSGTMAHPKIRFLTKVDLTPSYVPAERFVVDYRRMSGWSKTSAFELQTYDNGVIKSLNAESADQTKAIAANVVSSGISLVGLATGVSPPNARNVAERLGVRIIEYTSGGIIKLKDGNLSPLIAADDVSSTYSACPPETTDLLAAIDEATRALKAGTATLTGMNAEKARIDRLAGLNASTEETKKKLDDLQKHTETQAKRVADQDKDLADLIAKVSVREQVLWPRSSTDQCTDAPPNAEDRASLGKLIRMAPEPTLPIRTGYTDADLDRDLAMKACLVPVATSCESTAKASDDRVEDVGGLLYRTPVPARLVVCQASALSSCDSRSVCGVTSAASHVLVSSDVLAPQLGPLHLLPYTNGAFQNNVLKATFRENGSLATVNYEERSARGVELSETVSKGLDSVKAERDARRAAAEAKRKADLAKLDDEVARLEKTKKIDDLNAQLAYGSETAGLDAQKASLEARLAVRDAQRKWDTGATASSSVESP